MSTKRAKPALHPDDVAQARRLISETACIPAAELADDGWKLQDLGLDSVDLVELVLEVERNFGVEVPEQATGSLERIADVGALVAGCRRGFAVLPTRKQVRDAQPLASGQAATECADAASSAPSNKALSGTPRRLANS